MSEPREVAGLLDDPSATAPPEDDSMQHLEPVARMKERTHFFPSSKRHDRWNKRAIKDYFGYNASTPAVDYSLLGESSAFTAREMHQPPTFPMDVVIVGSGSSTSYSLGSQQSSGAGAKASPPADAVLKSTGSNQTEP